MVLYTSIFESDDFKDNLITDKIISDRACNITTCIKECWFSRFNEFMYIFIFDTDPAFDTIQNFIYANTSKIYIYDIHDNVHIFSHEHIPYKVKKIILLKCDMVKSSNIDEQRLFNIKYNHGEFLCEISRDDYLCTISESFLSIS